MWAFSLVAILLDRRTGADLILPASHQGDRHQRLGQLDQQPAPSRKKIKDHYEDRDGGNDLGQREMFHGVSLRYVESTPFPCFPSHLRKSSRAEQHGLE